MMALIGTHVSIAGGFDRAVARGMELSCEAIQFFSKNQLQWRNPALSIGKISSFMKAWSESGIKEIVVHGSYLVNPAASGALAERSRRAMVDEIEKCQILGISTLIVHPGSHTDCGLEEGLDRVVAFLKKILAGTSETDVRIALETMAGQGNSLCFRLEHLEYILSNLAWDPRLMICLDTAHLFAAGYELRSAESYDRLMKHLDKNIGCGRVACWHFNDSKGDKGSRIDRHEHLGNGKIGLTVFGLALNDHTWDGIPCILETPKKGPGDKANLSVLRKLRGR